MSLPVHFTLAARAEVIEAHDWYEQRRPGLGRRFVEVVDGILARIAAKPYQFPVLRGAARRAVLRGFPYSLFFLIDLVIACFHGRRNPAPWHAK